MKKFFTIICLMVALLLSSIKLNAQSTRIPVAFNVQGGYSWLNGVAGAEVQFGHISLSGGWMPCKMPLSGSKINSYGGAISYYTLPVNQEGYSSYVSVGVASQGYRYEDTWGGEVIEPMTIIMIGEKYNVGIVSCKLGGGYGWCDQAGAWTFEITLGFTLFSN
jgi:hypothetical protein